jgi:hypothetical protein
LVSGDCGGADSPDCTGDESRDGSLVRICAGIENSRAGAGGIVAQRSSAASSAPGLRGEAPSGDGGEKDSLGQERVELDRTSCTRGGSARVVSKSLPDTVSGGSTRQRAKQRPEYDESTRSSAPREAAGSGGGEGEKGVSGLGASSQYLRAQARR